MSTLQQEIIETLKVLPVIEPSFEIRRTIDFLKHYLGQYPFLKTLVLGISGGQDSTLAGRLCQLAIEEMRQEMNDNTYQFIAVRLPYGVQSDEDDAQAALKFINADKVVTVNIKNSVDEMVSALEQQGISVTHFNKGNIKARARMIAQYGIAGSCNGVVVGTDHAAEAITGFYTKFGDGGVDIVPLWRLNKRQGRQLLQYLNAPEKLYLKIPTADLEDDKPLIADEVALGVTYDEIDDYLEGKEIGEKSRLLIENWYQKSEHKRKMPITIFDKF